MSLMRIAQVYLFLQQGRLDLKSKSFATTQDCEFKYFLEENDAFVMEEICSLNI